MINFYDESHILYFSFLLLLLVNKFHSSIYQYDNEHFLPSSQNHFIILLEVDSQIKCIPGMTAIKSNLPSKPYLYASFSEQFQVHHLDHLSDKKAWICIL